MAPPRTTRGRASTVALVAAAALVAGPATSWAAGPPSTTTTPATSPVTVTVPVTASTTTTAPDPEGGTTVTVDDEASYRDALAALSAAPDGPNTLAIAADIVVDDGVDPTYTGGADLVIEGGGHTLDAAGGSRVLVVESAGAPWLTVRDLALTGGSATGDGGAVLVVGDGAQLRFERSTLSGNRATGDGGAVASPNGVEMEDTTVEGNVAAGAGGGLSAGETMGLTRVTFTGNRARTGGAVATEFDAGLIDATITANTATERGGGLSVGRDLYLIYGTLVANSAPVGANLELGRRQDLTATALADPRGGGANCAPAREVRTIRGFSDDTSCGGEAQGWTGTSGGDPGLGPLADNGGLTRTMLPAPDSPLVDAIDPILYWGGPMIGCYTWPDQRGVDRPQDGNGVPETGGATRGPYGPAEEWCDIGAVEREAPPTPATPVVVTPAFTG